MRIAWVVLIFVWLSSFASAGEPLHVTLGTIADGYLVKIGVNGADLPLITGGGAETVQLYSTDHPKKSESEPSWHLFCLHPGRNTIKIHYEQKKTRKSHPLPQIYMKSPAYKVDVFNFKAKDSKSGTFETVFELYDVMPKGYKTQQLYTKQ